MDNETRIALFALGVFIVGIAIILFPRKRLGKSGRNGGSSDASGAHGRNNHADSNSDFGGGGDGGGGGD